MIGVEVIFEGTETLEIMNNFSLVQCKLHVQILVHHIVSIYSRMKMLFIASQSNKKDNIQRQEKRKRTFRTYYNFQN